MLQNYQNSLELTSINAIQALYGILNFQKSSSATPSSWRVTFASPACFWVGFLGAGCFVFLCKDRGGINDLLCDLKGVFKVGDGM